jgi:predicted  nucleic acid-binding Zn-ribbon protein
VDLPRLIDPILQENTLKADPLLQLRLLDLQQLDSHLDGIKHRLATIPEAASLAELGPQRRATDNRLRDYKVDVADLVEEQKKADRDVEAVKTRRVRDQGMLDTGAIKNPKDAERMIHELESLSRRISDLEDVEIEVMERLETAQAGVEQTTTELTSIDERATTLEQARSVKAADLEKELGETLSERDQTAIGIPEDLLAAYTRLREQKGGVGAAALHAKQCQGCRLTLDASILRDITAAPEDDVIRCEECDRILVRTPESGL